MLNATRVDRSLADIDRRLMGRFEFKRQAMGMVACAVVWAIAVVAFVPFASPAEHFALWTLLVDEIASSAVTMSAAPIGTRAVRHLTGIATVLMFAIARQFRLRRRDRGIRGDSPCPGLS